MKERSLKKRIEKTAADFTELAGGMIKWLMISVIVGGIGGGMGTIFVYSVNTADAFFAANKWMIYVLPAGGLLIALMYNLAGIKTVKGVSRMMDQVRGDDDLSPVYIPIVFGSTILTHIGGGSAGREGAALQIGGSIGEGIGHLFQMNESDMSIMVLSGSAAMFSALFCAPLTATIFAMEVISVGVMYYGALLPCLASSLVAYAIARMAGLNGEPWGFLSMPDLDIIIILKVAVLGLICAAASVITVIAFDHTGKFFRTHLKNRYVRLLAGGAIMIVLTLLFPSGDFNGSGMNVITQALHGNADWFDFLIKLVFTALCLGTGYKGGEIVPTFYIGAALGCCAGGLLGIDPGFAAAIGIVATFCGAVNCPIASIILGIEFFGGGGIIYYATACAISFLMSGYYSLYGSQKIMYSKTTAKFINKRAK
jgi:Chloride channel protein EriC